MQICGSVALSILITFNSFSDVMTTEKFLILVYGQEYTVITLMCGI